MKLSRLDNPDRDPLVDVLNSLIAVLEGMDDRLSAVEDLQRNIIVAETLEEHDSAVDMFWEWYMARRQDRAQGRIGR